jgi:hypothetical protein
MENIINRKKLIDVLLKDVHCEGYRWEAIKRIFDENAENFCIHKIDGMMYIEKVDKC